MSIAEPKNKTYIHDFFSASINLETDECVNWIYGKGRGEYGLMKVNQKNVLTHREALRLRNGDAPDDKPHALHSCHNTSCFNYRHLRWGSREENMRDKIKDGTHLVGESLPASKLTTEAVQYIRTNKGTHAV